MSYKTILLHLNEERLVAGLVDVGAQIAGRYDAHLIGLYVIPSVHAVFSTSLGAGIIKSGMDRFRRKAQRVRASLEKLTQGHPIVTEWRLVEANNHDVAETVMDHGRVADLIIAGQRDRSWDHAGLLGDPERLTIESGRPVLIVPYAGHFAQFGRRITVAWNGRREAARATFNSLPLLKAAESVRIVWVNPQIGPDDGGDFPTADIAAALERHGVKCETAMSYAADDKVGDALLSILATDGSDVLVMGAYGRSRLREFVFSGTTRHIFQHMTAPVLMSH